MMGLSLTTLLPLLLSMLGRGKPSVELPIKEVIDIIGSLPPHQQEEPVDLIDIEKAQRMLSDAGFDPGPIDGKPGPMTQAATRQYQQSRGLEVDGLIGQKTWSKLLGEQGRGHA